MINQNLIQIKYTSNTTQKKSKNEKSEFDLNVIIIKIAKCFVKL